MQQWKSTLSLWLHISNNPFLFENGDHRNVSVFEKLRFHRPQHNRKTVFFNLSTLKSVLKPSFTNVMEIKWELAIVDIQKADS